MIIQKLSRFIFALFIFILFANPAFAQRAAKQASAGKLVEIKIPAPSLKGNLFGDPTEQNISIYFPPSYDATPTKRYPVIYLLHGYNGSNKTWTQETGYDFNTPPILDALVSGGKIREMIIVAPNGRNALGGSFYNNSAATGNWEDYIFRDVVAYVDAKYRTLARPSSRGIAGHSMGGYGAIFLGMKHPEVFGAIYALSPCCLGLEGDFNEPNPAWQRIGSLTSIDQLPKQWKSPDDFYTQVFPALSAAFAPNAGNKPFYADFLYGEQNGNLARNEAVYAKWKARMPLYMVDDYKQNLLSLRGIFLDYGQKEESSHIRIAASLFSKALAERGISHTFEIYADGTHVSRVKERLETRVFQFFSDRLDFSNPQ